MNKRGGWAIVISISLVVILVVGLFVFISLFKPGVDFNKSVAKASNSTKTVNPIANMTVEQIRDNFNETFVLYLLNSMKAYNLHNPPLSEDTPKINILIDSDSYSAEVVSSKIKVKKGEREGADIVITTTRAEAAQMVKNKSYVSQSFKNKGSSIELLAGSATLFAKGYMSLYSDLTK